MFSIDPISQLVHVAAELSLAELNRKLNAKGYCFSYFTPPNNDIRVGEALMRRQPNLYQAVYGGIEDLCVQVKWRRPGGQIMENVLTPRSATGPSLKKTLIGSGTRWGEPVEAVFRIHRAPQRTLAMLFGFQGADRRDAFLLALQKLRLPIPLSAQFSKEEVREWLRSEQDGEWFLGVALWGEPEYVAPFVEALQGLAASRKGSCRIVEEESAAGRFFERIRGNACGLMAQRQNGIGLNFKDQERLSNRLTR